MNDSATPFSPRKSRTRPARPRAALGRVFLFVILPILLSSALAIAAEDEAGAPAADSAEVEWPSSRSHVLWPLIFVDEAPEWRQFSFIPFFVERRSADNSEKRTQVLWPIFLYRRSDRDVTVRVVPFFTYSKDVYAFSDGEEYDTDYMLFPIVFGEDSTEEGRSLAVFPIAGRFRHFLGRDEIRFFMFPLYMESSKGELRRRNYLWPVLSFSEGGGAEGFRFWPFYGYFERPGEYRKEFVLWPIYNRQTFDLDKEQPGERVLVFPLYAREDSRSKRYRSTLWPFFSHEINYAGNFEERSTPWPFIVITRGDIHRTRLWPIYGFKRAGASEKRFWLWPFWSENNYALDTDLDVRETRLMPIWSARTETSDSGAVLRHKARFWPLWRFRRSEDGATRLRLLSLLWFDDERGFERHYSPLWTIYERETAPGAERASALWGLYRRSSAGGRSEARIPLLYSQTSDTERGAEVTKILGGLVATVKENGRRRLKLLHFSGPGREGNR